MFKTENLFDSGTFVLCLDHTNMCTDILADNCTNIVANICLDMLANISCIFVNIITVGWRKVVVGIFIPEVLSSMQRRRTTAAAVAAAAAAVAVAAAL